MLVAVIILVLTLAVLAALSLAGTRSLSRLVGREVWALAGRALELRPNRILLDDYPDLPPPVRRYLEYAGVDGRERIRFVRMRQGGCFRPGAARPWCPMEAVQYYAPGEVAFVWHATIRLFGIPVRGRDRLIDGHGRMLIKLLGFLPLVDLGGPELDAGSLLRNYSEAPWFPTALVPDEHLAWEAIDDRSAMARLRYGSVQARAVFRFDAQGRIVAFETDDRHMTVGKRFVRAHWFARLGDYQEVAGYRVPMAAEAGWLLPEGELVYARPAVEVIEYDRFEMF